MKNRQYERGQTLAETLVGISLALTVIGGVGFTVSRLGATELHTIATTQSQTVSQQLAQSLDDEARGALAIFIPSQDVNAVSNPVPPAGSIAQRGGTVAFDPRVSPVNDCATASREIDFYYRDGQHVPHIVAYKYDCANNKVIKYTYSHRDANGAAVGVQTLREYANVTWFGASYLNASQVPDVNPFVRANVHGNIADKLVYMGEPEVYAGNRLVAVQMAVGLATTKNGTTTIADPISQSLALVPRTFPQSRAVTTSYAPPHQPLSIDCSAFTFQQGVAGSVNQSGTNCGKPSGGNIFVATDPNYIGQYTLQPQNCAGAGVIITANGGTNGPSSGYTIGTGSAVAPGTTVSCVVRVLTSDPAITGAVTVAVVATPTPAPPPPTAPPVIPPTNPPFIPPNNPPPNNPPNNPPNTPPPAIQVCPPGTIGNFPNCSLVLPPPPLQTPPTYTVLHLSDATGSCTLLKNGFLRCGASVRSTFVNTTVPAVNPLPDGTYLVTLDTCLDFVTLLNPPAGFVATGQGGYIYTGTLPAMFPSLTVVGNSKDLGDAAGAAAGSNSNCPVSITFGSP